MNITFDEGLTFFTNQTPSVTVEAGTYREGIAKVFGMFPALYVHLAGGGFNAQCALILNDEEVLEFQDMDSATNPDDNLFLLDLPVGRDPGTLGVVTATTVATMKDVVVLVAISVAVALLMQFVIGPLIGALMGGMSTPSAYQGTYDNSASYTFDGIKNTTASGTPLQLVYGTHRTGGQVLALSTETEDTKVAKSDDEARKLATQNTSTHLKYLIGISEGEVEKISDVELNKLPQSFYSAVQTAWKPGTKNQGVMTELGLNQIQNTTTISRKVLNLSSKVTLPKPQFTDLEPVYGYVTIDNRGRAEVVRKRVRYELTYEYNYYGS